MLLGIASHTTSMLSIAPTGKIRSRSSSMLIGSKTPSMPSAQSSSIRDSSEERCRTLHPWFLILFKLSLVRTSNFTWRTLFSFFMFFNTASLKLLCFCVIGPICIRSRGSTKGKAFKNTKTFRLFFLMFSLTLSRRETQSALKYCSL